MRKCRITYLTGGFSVGGTERHLATILPRLKAKGYKIDLISLGPDGPMSRPIKDAGINIIPIHSKSRISIPKLRGFSAILTQLTEVKAVLRDLSPDILHCFLGVPSILGGLLHIASPSFELVISKRNQLSRPDSFFKEGAMELFAMKRAKAVLAHSTVVRDELLKAGVYGKNLWLVHNGINAEPYKLAKLKREDLRSRFGWSQDIVFVMLANLIPYKGHNFLLNALSKLSSSDFGGNPWRVVLIGTGEKEYETFLRERVRQEKLTAKVSFLGGREDIPEILAACDIGLLLSEHEGFSNAVLEYMASGLPTIATGVGGNIDAVKDDSTGKLIEFSDDVKLSSAFVEFLSDDKKRIKMGHEASHYLESNFSLNKCVAGYENVYSEILH